LERYMDAERAAEPAPPADRQVPAVRGGDGGGDAEAEAGPSLAAGAAGAVGVERPSQRTELVLGHAAPGVLDGEHGLARDALGAEPDLVAGRGVLDGVLDEGVDGHHQPGRIDDDRGVVEAIDRPGPW